MPASVAFIFLGLFGLGISAYGIKLYKTPLNPLTMFVVTQVTLSTICSGLISWFGRSLSSIPYEEKDVVFTIFIASIYSLGVFLPYLFRTTIFSKIYENILRSLQLTSEKVFLRFNFFKFLILLGSSVGSFLLLAILGGGGIKWITDPRTAYLLYRGNVGGFFLLTQWLLMYTFLYYLWSHRPRLIKLLIGLSLFSILMYFLGSKSNILSLWITGVVYYHFLIRNIELSQYFLIFPLFVFAILILLFLQGSYENLLDSTSYFQDYFDTTAQFLSRFDEFGLHYGQAMISNAWLYIPRGLYPDKPYEYGLFLIHKVLYPGLAEEGHTAGILAWSIYYLDFGTAGVFVGGLANGIFRKVAYESFLKKKKRFFSFLFMIQFSIWEVMILSSTIIVILFSIVQSIFMRSTFMKSTIHR